ncbi:MAG TPA: DUF2141 domain-containing protein [Prolixibacteraceae bacterium]|nr:DUF2141 domain-containing protein [Prolixibacteraceae bacterium]HPS12686.1 DUF2141 domain-containing protein [Prolixibacteraceae bacterium]
MKLLISILLILSAFPAFSQHLTVEISGISTDKGVILLSAYRDKETFKAETPYKIYHFEKSGMKGGNLTITISDLEPGTYGLALIDDKNENGKMDYHLFVPSEGFGFSNYLFKGTCKPDFDKFSFKLSSETKIDIRAQYFFKTDN